MSERAYRCAECHAPTAGKYCSEDHEIMTKLREKLADLRADRKWQSAALAAAYDLSLAVRWGRAYERSDLIADALDKFTTIWRDAPLTLGGASQGVRDE